MRTFLARTLVFTTLALWLPACSGGTTGTPDAAVTDASDAHAGDGAVADAPDAHAADGAVADAPDARSADGSVADGSAGNGCVAQSIEACACSTPGVTGTRECLPDGSRFGACDCTVYGREIFVAVDGNDAAAGTADTPKGTLDGALSVVRGLAAGGGLPAGGVVIWMAGGVYPVAQTVSLGADLGSSPDKPVVIRARAGAPVRLVGGTRLPSTGFAPVSDSDPSLARIDPAARANIRVFDLTAAGITDFGALATRGFCASGVHSAMEVFVDGAPMRLGRWPDVDTNDVTMPTPTSASIDLYGTVSPDVTGHYVKTGETDGASFFTRQGLVNGKQYQLYHLTWTYNGAQNKAWFLTTSQSGYPSNSDPWWYLYATGLTQPMDPTNGATGQVFFTDPQGINHGFASTVGAPSDHSFTYAQDRPSGWAAAPDAWLHGFWKYGWADCHLPLAALDPAQKTITLGSAPSLGLASGAPWYAYNLLEEVTQPGEWYVDRTRGRLYLYPPHDLASAEVLVSRLDGAILRLNNVDSVRVQGLVLEVSRGNLLEINGGTHNRAVGVTLRNSGADGADIDGVDNGVTDALVFDVGSTGVALKGGDRPSLTPANNFVERSNLHHYARWDWTYRPAVDMRGVAQRASNNLIHDAPHNAVLYAGNEHHIELNEIHDTNRFSGDAGAIYGGRDWGGRGIVIRNNYIHDLRTYFAGLPIAGVYLDDCLSGNRVEGNLLVDIDGIGILHGGGRDVLMLGNVMARASTGLSSDARCSTWAKPNDTPGDSNNLLEKLLQNNYQSPPWSVRYPECAAIPNNYPAIFDPAAGWLFPEGSRFTSNVSFQSGTWMLESDGAFAHYVQSDNPELTSSPFVDEAAGNLALTPTVLATPGFTPIPVDQIGIH